MDTSGGDKEGTEAKHVPIDATAAGEMHDWGKFLVKFASWGERYIESEKESSLQSLGFIQKKALSGLFLISGNNSSGEYHGSTVL